VWYTVTVREGEYVQMKKKSDRLLAQLVMLHAPWYMANIVTRIGYRLINVMIVIASLVFVDSVWWQGSLALTGILLMFVTSTGKNFAPLLYSTAAYDYGSMDELQVDDILKDVSSSLIENSERFYRYPLLVKLYTIAFAVVMIAEKVLR